MDFCDSGTPMRHDKHTVVHRRMPPVRTAAAAMALALMLFLPAAPQAKIAAALQARRGASAYPAGRLSSQQATDLERRMRPFLESRLRGLSRPECPAEADLFLLVSMWKSLSPEFKALYKKATQIPAAYNSCPSPGGWFEIYYVTDVSDSTNGVSVTDTISYGVSGDWRPRRAVPNGIPDYIDETAWALDSCWSMEVERFGFIAPIPLHDSVHTSSRYPVVVTSQDWGYYGQTFPDTAPAGTKGYASHIELRNEWNDAVWRSMGYDTLPENGIRVTCAHELFHGIQYAMAWDVLSVVLLDDFPLGWIEGTAVLMEELGFDYVNDYLQYSGEFFNDPFMSFFGNANVYSNSLLTKYLYTQTNGIGMVRNAFFSNYASATAFSRNLETVSLTAGLPWAVLLNRFHTASYHTGSRADTSLFFPDAEFLGQWSWSHDSLPASFSISKPVQPYGMRLFSFAPDSTDSDTACFAFACTRQDGIAADGRYWASSAIIRRLAGGDSTVELTKEPSGGSSICVTGWQSTEDIVITVSSGFSAGMMNATACFMPRPAGAALRVYTKPRGLRARKLIRFEGGGVREVRIYSVDGTLVASSTGSSFLHYARGFIWRLVNENGAAVAPGFYSAFLTLTGKDGRKEIERRKLMVFP